MTDTNIKTKKLDNISIYISGFCLIHCLTFPILSVSIPFYGFFTENHFHEILLFLIIPISSFALYRGFKNHKNRRIISVGIIGGILVFLGATILHNQANSSYELIITAIGSVLLALAHFNNNRVSHY
tara:strand:- start:1123 stop:1503 length:381 start_codon:yes stop_codon:yes gene_type:complete